VFFTFFKRDDRSDRKIIFGNDHFGHDRFVQRGSPDCLLVRFAQNRWAILSAKVSYSNEIHLIQIKMNI
jgi:hypothetical protein